MPLSDWLPTLTIGLFFTSFALLKIYGRRRGIIGGGNKPLPTRMCGSCPTWTPQANIALIALFLAIGLLNLAYLAWSLLSHTPPK